MNQKPKKLHIGLPPENYCQVCGSFNIHQIPFHPQMKCQDCFNTWTVELPKPFDQICVPLDAETEIGFSISRISAWIYYRIKTPSLRMKMEGQTQDIVLSGDSAKAVYALLKANATEIFQEDVTENIAVKGYMRA